MAGKKLRELEQPSRYKDLLRAIARFQVNNSVLSLAAIIAITIFLLGGISQVRTVASLEKMMPSDVEEIKAFNDLRDNNLGQDMLAVLVEVDSNSAIPAATDILDYSYYTYVKHVAKTLSMEDAIISAYAFSDVVDFYASKKGINVIDGKSYELLLSDPLVKQALTRFTNDERTNTIILLSTDISASDARMDLLSSSIKHTLASLGTPQSTTLSLTGTPIIQQKLGEIIEHDRKLTERISALFVFLLVGIVFGSLAAAIVPMVTIILSIIWLYGLMGYFGLPISTLAGGVAAMVIGIGVDYSIHLRNKFEYEIKKGETLEYAVEETMANTGYVLTTVTIVTAIAFLTFLLGKMPEMGRFGLLMGMGVSLAFLLSVIGLPALFIFEKKVVPLVKATIRGE